MAREKKTDGFNQWKEKEAKRRTTALNSLNAGNAGKTRSKRKPKVRKSQSR